MLSIHCCQVVDGHYGNLRKLVKLYEKRCQRTSQVFKSACKAIER
jgi:hypothetical protein